MPSSAVAFRRWRLVFLVLLLAVVAVAVWWRWCQLPPQPTNSARAPSSTSLPRADNRLRGVSWVAGDSVSSLDLEPLVRAHVTWIAQTPFGWQAGAATPEIQLHTGVGHRGYWGESDRGLTLTSQRARQRGIRTLLKPHLWLRGGSGTWPGDVKMNSEVDWQRWFASYSVFMLHYARLAETSGMEALCIGTELQHSVGHEAEWRALIAQVRAVYHGQLTYAANWNAEFEQVRFWDALDFIGIQAYFPLSATERPTKAALLKAWQEPLRRIAALQRKVKKPVVFTEIGYKTTPDAAIEPWSWPDRTAVLTTPDETTQATCYAAMFETFWPRKWFQGLFVWKWYPGLQPAGSARRHLDFTPQHKPAERVMAAWFAK
ncbi:glycoside hydrolase family 113 [Hymenobacter glacieicola]|nr:glycoside hydrolase TIM-barrel-like domain-containing protein [Hymenobacter glacieicola]